MCNADLCIYWNDGGSKSSRKMTQKKRKIRNCIRREAVMEVGCTKACRCAAILGQAAALFTEGYHSL